mgnify:CR=1 FL=1
MNERIAKQIEEMKKQTIGVEVEMNNIRRDKAAELAATFFGTGRSGMLTSYILLGLLLSICRYQKTAPEPVIRSWRWRQGSQS